MQQRAVIRGGAWLFLRLAVVQGSGFAYWLVISALGGAAVLGYASLVVAIGNLLVGLSDLGIRTGLARHLGQARLSEDPRSRDELFSAALAVRMAVSAALATALLLAPWPSAELRLVALLSAALALVYMSSVIEPVLVAYMKSWAVLLSGAAGSAAKLAVGIPLVALGYGFLGAALGHVAGVAAMTFSAALAARLETGISVRPPTLAATKRLLKAGFSVWLPDLVVLVGHEAGVIAVFGAAGGAEAGYYYLAMAYSAVVTAVALSLLQQLLPVLSGMADGRKRALHGSLRLALALSTPLAAVLAAFPAGFLSLVGEEYASGALALSLLSAAAPPTILSYGVLYLMLAYERYRSVLGIGLASSLPRLVLYALLAPAYSGAGAAAAFLAGSLSGLIAASANAGRSGYRMGWKTVGLTVLIPAAYSIGFSAAGLHWAFSSAAVLALSYLSYMRAGVLRRSDLRELAYALAPRRAAGTLEEKLAPLLRVLLPE